MIWLTWRQFRTQAVAVFAALAALAVILAVTGPQLAQDYANGIATCNAGGGCSTFMRTFFDDNRALYFGLVVVTMVVPGIIGLFWGAPLITRELEAGTHRLVWNQSVTRTRWLAVKLGLTGLAAMAAGGLLSLAVTWWSSPIDKAGSSEFPRFSPVLFASRDIAPIGYAAFAFALGVTVGMLFRRMPPAMAVTLAVFVAVQIVMPLWIRPYLIPPVQVTTAITATNLDGFMASSPDGPIQKLSVTINEPGAWIISNRTIDATGNAAQAIPSWVMGCLPPPPGLTASSAGQQDQQSCFAKLTDLGYRQQVTYQPDNRYWAFQWSETTIFLTLAVLQAGFCFWWIRRRLS
jgi:MFS family permease